VKVYSDIAFLYR